MRVVLAGATGVIGRQAVPELTRAGHQVIALARKEIQVPDAEVVVADALDADALRKAVRMSSPDAVVSMLSAIPDPIDPKHLTRDMALTNRLRVEATANLIAAAGGARVIVQSLAYAYDPTGPEPMGEGAPLWRKPPRQFATTLDTMRVMEREIAMAGGVSLRLGHLYGPGSSYSISGSFTNQVRAGEIPLVGRGNSTFSFVHAHDVATAILAAVERPVVGAFNIVDDDPTPVRNWLPAMAAMIGAATPRRVPVWLARLAEGGWGVAFMTRLAGASNGRAWRELDWKPSLSSWRDGFAGELN